MSRYVSRNARASRKPSARAADKAHDGPDASALRGLSKQISDLAHHAQAMGALEQARILKALGLATSLVAGADLHAPSSPDAQPALSPDYAPVILFEREPEQQLLAELGDAARKYLNTVGGRVELGKGGHRPREDLGVLACTFRAVTGDFVMGFGDPGTLTSAEWFELAVDQLDNLLATGHKIGASPASHRREVDSLHSFLVGYVQHVRAPDAVKMVSLHYRSLSASARDEVDKEWRRILARELTKTTQDCERIVKASCRLLGVPKADIRKFTEAATQRVTRAKSASDDK